MSDGAILVFDVTETLLDLSGLAATFAEMFGDPAVLRSWFDNLVVYFEALTLSGVYEDAGSVGAAVLRMLAEARGVTLSSDGLQAFKRISASLPAYPDVAPGLRELRRAGYRLATLSNSPLATCETQLASAGVRSAFERLFSVDERVKRYKPARETYLDVARALGSPPADVWLVSCHPFDCLGAAAAGLSTALILRPGYAPFALGPQPDVIARDVPSLARALAERAS